MPDWLKDLLLESVAPPSNWLPTRAERLADARTTLRRRFGAARESDVRRSHHLRDLGAAHPLIGGSRVVPGDEIEAAMEIEITTVNPPDAQGWIVLAGGIVFVVELFMVKQFVTAPGVMQLGSIASVAVAPLAWLAAILVVGWLERTIELDERGVRIRRWTERWLRRPGISLGQPNAIMARLDGPVSLVMGTPTGSTRLSLALWPDTAREDLVDELPIWGVDCAFGHHRRRAERPGRRRRQLAMRAGRGEPKDRPESDPQVR